MSTVNFSETLFKKTNTRLVFAFAASILLSACGSGGGSGSEAAVAESAGTDNQVPEVVEQAPEQVTPVQIFSHPQNLVVTEGQAGSLSVAASGGGSLAYQWLKNAREIEGANGSSLTFNSAKTADAGVYSVVVSNGAGSKTSLSAVLTVKIAPSVIVVPPQVEAPDVETPVVEVPVVEVPVVEEPVVEVPVVEEPVVEVPVVEEPVIEEPVVEVPVVEPLTIVAQPVSQIVEEADSVNLSIEVSGGAEVSFQWLKDGAIIDGAQSELLVIASATVQDAGEYSVVITSSAGVAFSDAATLIVNEDAPIVVPVAKSIALSWDIPQQREDGTALETYEIDGYVIAYGTDANNLDQQITVEGALVHEAVLEDLTEGTYYFAIATVDSDGMQGAYSAVIEQSI